MRKQVKFCLDQVQTGGSDGGCFASVREFYTESLHYGRRGNFNLDCFGIEKFLGCGQACFVRPTSLKSCGLISSKVAFVLHDVGRAGYIRRRNIWDQARIFQSLSFAIHGSGRVSTLASFALRCIIAQASAAVSGFGLTRTDIAASQAIARAIERLEIEFLETKIHLLSTPSRGTTRGSDHKLYLVNFREPRVSNEFTLRQKHP